MRTLTAIVPAYNEEVTIEKSLNSLIKQNYISEIILINDGSADNTLDLLNQFKQLDNRVKVFSNIENKGKGYSLNSVRNLITSEYVVIHDADLEYDPNDMFDMYQLISGDNLVLGTRFKGSKQRTNIYYRTFIANKIMSKFFSFVHRSNVSDIATCYKMMPSKFFKNTSFKEKGFSIEIEIVAKFLKTNREIIETPISYNGRSYEEGKKIKTLDGFLYLFNTLKYKLVN